MAWFVKTMKHKEGWWTKCAESDEGGGFYEGCSCRHETEADAHDCLIAEISLGSATGFQVDQYVLAQIAYEAYCRQAKWKSLATGAPLPQWDGLSVEIKAGWYAASREVRKAMALMVGKLVDRLKDEVRRG